MATLPIPEQGKLYRQRFGFLNLVEELASELLHPLLHGELACALTLDGLSQMVAQPICCLQSTKADPARHQHRSGDQMCGLQRLGLERTLHVLAAGLQARSVAGGTA